MTELSIILPVHNEKDTIETVLKEWSSVLKKHRIKYSFLICEDGSTDGTKELLKKIKNKYKLLLNQDKKRRGYGKAVIDGFSSVKSEYILCIDSDGQCDPNDFKKFWQNRDKTDVLIGWRKKRADTLSRKLFSNLFKSLFYLLFPVTVHDPSAPFVLFKKEKIISYTRQLTYLQEGFWWGFIGTCVKNNLKIKELLINHRNRLHGKTQVYHLKKIPSIAIRNTLGLIKLRIS